MNRTTVSARHWRQWSLLALAALLLLVAGTAGYRWLQGNAASPFVTAADCQLTAGCLARDGTREVRLQFNQPPGSHQRFTVTATLSGVIADTVTLDLQGVEMFMGLNRYPLQPLDDSRYHAEIQLPVCTTGRMQWQARLLLQQAAQTEAAVFHFWTE